MKKAPRVLAKYFVGAAQGTSTFADLRGTGRSEDVIIAARARLTAYDPKGNQLWESAPKLFNLSFEYRSPAGDLRRPFVR